MLALPSTSTAPAWSRPMEAQKDPVKIEVQSHPFSPQRHGSSLTCSQAKSLLGPTKPCTSAPASTSPSTFPLTAVQSPGLTVPPSPQDHPLPLSLPPLLQLLTPGSPPSGPHPIRCCTHLLHAPPLFYFNPSTYHHLTNHISCSFSLFVITPIHIDPTRVGFLCLVLSCKPGKIEPGV